MNRIRYLFNMIGICLLCACSGEEEIPALDLAQETYTVDAKGETLVVEINSNGSWTLNSRVEWCVPAVGSGAGNGKVKVKVYANDTEHPRTGVIILQGQEMEREITVLQDSLVLIVDTSKIWVPTKGEVMELKVFSNSQWKVECNARWVHLNPFSGEDTSRVRITIDPSSKNERNTVLNVISGSVSQSIALVQVDWYEDGEVRMYRPEDAGNRIRLVFMGDGFTREDLVKGGGYDQAMSTAIETYFSVEPYKTYRHYFCPYIVYACSKDRGISIRKDNQIFLERKNTVFNMDVLNSGRMVNGDILKIEEYAQKVPGIDFEKSGIVVLGNDPHYGGRCFQFQNGESIGLLTMHPNQYKKVLIHEAAGHGFGRLADEYVDFNWGTMPEKEIGRLNETHAYGMNLNITAPKDETNVFWKDFIGRPGYETVGFFEGSWFYSKGVWRSENICSMRDNTMYFSIGCRLAIVKRLKAIAGESFDLEDFIAKDVRKSFNASATTTAFSLEREYPPLPPPVWMDR